MYPLQCYGNIPNPLRAGKHEIVAVSATVDNDAADSRLTLIDDNTIPTNSKVGKIYDGTYDLQGAVIDINGVGGVDGTLTWTAPGGHAIKTRHGLSIMNSTNLVANSIKVYVR
ncbi:hypothetical protein [Neptuniibacter sp.]|uniref:hypothetical protein n=1 Tax=Neptuniibacter sp. TaxID=1962643 RepID=UPI002637F497|nr:hypothetical protein [Neptuniibacter sp.]MCP4597054.1 hypothetical protein [Neptuniibacter sp.]